MISLIIPSRNRVDGLVRSIENLKRTVDAAQTVEILAVLDRPDTQSIQTVGTLYPDVRIVLMPETYVNGFPQQKWQAGYLAAKGDWIAQITDDIELAPGWLEACLATPNHGIIGFADPNWCGVLMTLLMARREYIETVMHGRFGLPWYYVEWADNEWTVRAQRAQAAVWCPQATFVHHRHHDGQRQLTADKPAKDQATFYARLENNFPEEWPEAK